MKHVLRLRSFFLLMGMVVFGIKAMAQVPYTVLSDYGMTITFYYDEQCDNRNGHDISSIVTQPDDQDWGCDRNSVRTIVFDSSFANFTGFTSTANWFHDFHSLKTIIGLENLNTENVTDMKFMFARCYHLTSLDLSGFNTSKVTDMHQMFYICQSLTCLDLSSFDTSRVTDMKYMFDQCHSLTNINVSSFDTSNVTSMESMFANCEYLTSPDLSNFNTPNVTSMLGMFAYDQAITILDLSNFDTTNVLKMTSMFNGCKSLRTIYGSDWNTSKVKDSMFMFNNCTNLAGGQGTHCRVQYERENGHLYARIDRGKDSPGLFTVKDPTHVMHTITIQQNSTPVYNLSGQHLSAPQKGINIIGGRKVVMK